MLNAGETAKEVIYLLLALNFSILLFFFDDQYILYVIQINLMSLFLYLG